MIKVIYNTKERSYFGSISYNLLKKFTNKLNLLLSSINYQFQDYFYRSTEARRFISFTKTIFALFYIFF